MIQAATPMQRDATDANAECADRFEGRARRQAVRVLRKIVLLALFLTTCMWGFIGWSLWTEYANARAVGCTEGYNLTAAFAMELTNELDAANAVLESIAGTVKSSPDDEIKPGVQQVATGMANKAIGVRIAGPDGKRLLTTFKPEPGPTDFAHQPDFIGHRDNPSIQMTIDAYTADPAGLFIQVSRRLETADGRFAGEAILLLNPAYLMTLTRRIDLGRRGTVAIADENGIARAGFGRNDLDGHLGVGTDLRGSTYPEHIAPGQTALYSRRGPILNIDRLVTIRRLERYDLRVAVALDLDDVLGSARTHIWLMSLVGIGATGLMVTLSLLLMREMWRRTKREIDLAYDRDRLRSAQSQIEADRARLAETNRELLASKETAEAANRARSQFLAHMSHELRTPLHAIIGFSELIQEQAPTKPGSPPIAGYAADIWSSGRHLLELINAILDISKVESGTATLSETVFPVADLARAGLVSVRAQAEARHIALDLNLPEAIVRVRGDRTRLLQVLINLLSNAVKFTPNEGRILLTVSIPSSGELVFSVADTGIGMTEAEIQIAMEPFGQVDNTLSRSFEGTGLGLPLAHKLTELHGGRLELISIKGRGTTAYVYLPPERLVQRDAVRTGVAG
ncbi:MAG TPA: hypothetical protein DDZ81_09705 [Acetobacteraceae bacterium]|nr:hypothetical protein [Acetobacteraceae bacterium]